MGYLSRVRGSVDEFYPDGSLLIVRLEFLSASGSQRSPFTGYHLIHVSPVGLTPVSFTSSGLLLCLLPLPFSSSSSPSPSIALRWGHGLPDLLPPTCALVSVYNIERQQAYKVGALHVTLRSFLYAFIYSTFLIPSTANTMPYIRGAQFPGTLHDTLLVPKVLKWNSQEPASCPHAEPVESTSPSRMLKTPF